MATPTSRQWSDTDGLQDLYPTIRDRYKAEHDRAPIPVEVWGFFHDLQLLQNVREEEEIVNVVWALYVFVTTCQHADRRSSADVARWLIAALPAKEHAAWYMMCEEGKRAQSLVSSHPNPRSLYGDPEGVAKSPISVAVILLDFEGMWSELLQWQRTFLSKQVADGAPAIFKETREVVEVMQPKVFAYVYARQLMRAGSSPLALKLLCESPAEKLSEIVEFGDPAETHSYFELHTRFLTHGANTQANDFLKHLVKTEAYSDESLTAFMQNEKLKDVVSFILQYISQARGQPVRSNSKRTSSHSPAPRRKCCFCFKSSKPRAASKPALMLRTSNVPQVLLRELLVKYDSHDSGGREFLLHEREFQQALELFLLLNESDVLVRMIERLNDTHQSHLRVGLKEWARLHWLRILEHTKSTYNADAPAILDIVSKKGLWTWDASDGRSHYFESDARNSEDIAIVLWMFFEASMFLDPTIISNFMIHGKSRDPPMEVMDVFMPASSKFFDTVASNLSKREPNLKQSEMKVLMRNPGYYDPGIQGFLKVGEVEKPRAVFHEELAFARLMQVVARLFSFRDGSMDKETLESSLGQISSSCDGDSTCLNLMCKVMDATLQKKDMDFLPDNASDIQSDPSAFTVAGLASCARRLRVACDTVRNQPVQLTFGKVVNAFLETPPRGWVPLFNSLETVLFFLRFMEREDLKLAYEKFKEENEKVFSSDDSMKEMLGDTMAYYKEAFINLSEDVTDLCNLDVRSKLAKRRLPSKKKQSDARRFTNDDWNLVVEIAACAAESMKEKYNVPMLPHHTQMITLLMFAAQVCRGPGEFTMPRTVLARVGTGEGKSWIIGMLAAFVAKRGLTAHVVIDNDTLLERDFATMSALFQKFNLSACKGNLGKGHQVVYCSCMDIELYFMERMKEGVEDIDFRRCVMIVDEVDSLIVDDNVYQCYVDDYAEGCDIAEWWCAQGRHESKYNFEPWKRKVIDSLEKAEMEISSKSEGRSYIIDDNSGMVWALDERTAQLKRSAWYLWLELLRKQYISEYRIRYMTRQNVICKKSCFASYSFIFGLTGSLGTEAEKAYTKKHFNASVFMVPPFLDTCKGTSRPRPRCIRTCMESNGHMQLQRTVQIVQEYCSSVPILVVVRNPDRVQEIAENLRRVLLDHAVGDKLGPGVIELLDRPGKEAEFQQLVEVATQPLEAMSHTGKAMRTWRVTVTTAIGARGQDYHISDELVDEKGGFLLVLEYVPDSEREWIQFLGRTARHDHPGQYAVVLNMDEYNFLSPGAYESGNVVKQILDHMNTINEKRLEETEEQLERGMFMHDLTALFWSWAKKNKGDKKVWQDKFSEWVDLCETFEGKSPEDIKKAFDELKLGVSANSGTSGNNRADSFWEIMPSTAQVASGSDTGVYTGATEKGVRHGHGKCTFSDGRVFEGQWQHGKMAGKGKMQWPDGKVYEGQFEDDKRCGDGKICWADGQVYNGQWVNGKQHGHGMYTNKQGASWEGEWAGGKKVGNTAVASASSSLGSSLSAVDHVGSTGI